MNLWNLTGMMNFWPIWFSNWPGFKGKLGPSEVLFSTALLTQWFYKKSWVECDTCTTIVAWLCSKYRVKIKICQLLNLNCSSPGDAKITPHCLTGNLPYRFQFSDIAPNSHNCRIRPRPSHLQRNISNVTALLRVTRFWDCNFATFALNELFSDIHWAPQKKLKRISISPSDFLADSTVD